jgi:DNA-binding NtrC family response regulator
MPSAPKTPNLLIVDDDQIIQRLLVIAARDRGWRPESAATGDEALALLKSATKAVILDHGLPGMDGIETLKRIRERDPEVPVIMLTGLNDAETAVRALRAGADDYLTKPFELQRLFDLLLQACEKPKARPVAASKVGAAGGEAAGLADLLGRMRKAAQLDSTILLSGESGTGKSYFAREIHRMGPRAGEEFVTVSCPALPRELLESELFGHEKGAFTGATSSRVGRFEQATRGTIFLDEIGDLPPELQPKLLTVLQDREFYRVGGSKLLRTEARVIAATNIDLKARVEAGAFREDLYYRLNIIELTIPPLRDRLEDLPGLVDSLLAGVAKRRGAKGWEITPAGLEVLRGYHWPGNVRQLGNVLERATVFAEGEVLDAIDFIPLLEAGRERVQPGRPQTLQELEREALIQTYIRSGRNKARTARELGISERSVYNLLGRYGLK